MATRPGLTRHRGGERGIALPGVLVFAAVLVGVSGWLIGHVRADAGLGMLARADDQGARLADAAGQIVAMALGSTVDWRPVPAVAPPCPAPPGTVMAADESSERAWVQAETDAASRWAGDTPRWQLAWRCHAAAVLGRWPGPGTIPVVLVWVADDPEGDGQPLVSSNERLLIRVLALGPGGVRGVVAFTVERSSPGSPVTLGSWRPRAAM